MTNTQLVVSYGLDVLDNIQHFMSTLVHMILMLLLRGCKN